MKRKLPNLMSDAEAVIANADLTDDDFSGMVRMRFEMKPKNKSVNLRVPEQLLDAVRDRALKSGIPYQRFIRLAIEHALQQPSARR